MRSHEERVMGYVNMYNMYIYIYDSYLLLLLLLSLMINIISTIMIIIIILIIHMYNMYIYIYTYIRVYIYIYCDIDTQDAHTTDSLVALRQPSQSLSGLQVGFAPNWQRSERNDDKLLDFEVALPIFEQTQSGWMKWRGIQDKKLAKHEWNMSIPSSFSLSATCQIGNWPEDGIIGWSKVTGVSGRKWETNWRKVSKLDYCPEFCRFQVWLTDQFHFTSSEPKRPTDRNRWYLGKAQKNLVLMTLLQD